MEPHGEHPRPLPALARASGVRKPGARAALPPGSRAVMDGADAAWDVRERAHAGLILDAMDQAGNIVAVLEVADVACGLRVITANTALSRALGRGVAEIEGSPADFLADDADPARPARLRDALRLGEPLQETIGVQVEGRQVWIGLRLMPAGSGTSVPRRFVLLGRDITERRRRADADGAMQVLLGQAFRQAGIAMAVVETSGTIVMSNQQFHTLCGRPASAIDGRNFTRQLHLDDIPEIVVRRERQTADSQSYDMTVRLVRPDGGVVPVQLHCNLLENRTLRRLRIVTLTPVPAAAAPAAAVPGMPAPEPAPASAPGFAPEPASRPVVLAGGISLVGLEGVRQALGDRWPAVAQRVVASAEHVLRRHLLPDESFSRQSNGTGFVVCFSGADARRSELRAAAITREIRTRLIGEMDDAGLAATTLALDPQPITQAELAEPAGTLSGLLEQRLKRRRGALEDQARAALAEAAATARCLLVPATTPAGVPVPLALVDLPDTLRRSLDTAMLTLPEAEMRGFDPSLLRLDGLAEAALERGGDGRAAGWIVPVDFDSLTLRHRRERCMTQLSALPAVLRQRVTPLLSQLPRSVYQARVVDALRMLKGYGRAVGIEVDDLDALPFDPRTRTVGLVLVTGAALSDQLRRRRSAALAATLQRLRAESIRVVARDTAGLAAADLARLGVDLVVNEAAETRRR